MKNILVFLFVIGFYGLSNAQMIQLKDVAFYDEAGDWPDLEKVDGDSYKIAKSSGNGTSGELYIDVYKSKKIESDEAVFEQAFDSYISSSAYDNKKDRTLTNSELQGTEAFDIKAYQYEANESGQRIWGEVWVYHHKSSGKTYVFTAVLKNSKSGVSEPLKEELLMMLGTVTESR